MFWSWPLGTLQAGSRLPLTRPPFFCLLSRLPADTTWCSRLILYFPGPGPELGSPLRRNQDLGTAHSSVPAVPLQPHQPVSWEVLPEVPAPGPSFPCFIFSFLVSFSFLFSCSAVFLLSVNALNTHCYHWPGKTELDLVPALPDVPG